MADQPSIRLNKVLRELNISLDRAVEFLNQKGIEVDARPTTKITTEVYNTLLDEFETDKSKKVASHEISEEKRKEKENLRILQEKKEQERLDQIAQREALKTNKVSLEKPKTLGKIDLESLNKPTPKDKEEKPLVEKEEEVKPVEVKKPEEEIKEKPAVAVPVKKPEEKKQLVDEAEKPAEVNETIKTQYTKLTGPKKTGQTINLDEVNKKEKTVEDARKRKRKRISKEVKPSANKNNNSNNRGQQRKGRPNTVVKKEEPTEEEVQKQIRETLEKLQGKSNKSKGAKYRRDKRVQHRQKSE